MAEFSLRYALFGESEIARSLAWRWDLRRPGLYADALFDDDYWKLTRAFGPADRRRAEAGTYDPLLGWRAPRIESDYNHRERGALGERRPVLLYGASFVAKYFPESFAQTELADEYCLLSYGVGGFGPDQTLLLLRESIDHFVEQDPVVVLGWVVSGDFDRAVLSFRTLPKPRGRVDSEGRVVFSPEPVPTVAETYECEIGSYLLSAVERGLPEGVRAFSNRRRQQEKEELIAALVAETHHELESRGIEYFYLLFNPLREVAAVEASGWQEPFLVDLFEAEGIQYELARTAQQQAAAQSQVPLSAYFLSKEEKRSGHPSAAGVDAVMECFRRQLTRGTHELGARGATHSAGSRLPSPASLPE